MNNNLKIVSIGPYSPFRGGISDFNHHLVTQLKNSHDVTILNFKKLYPKIFFPGKSQYKNNASNNNSSLRILNPLNILSWRKAIKKINELNTDIAIFSYWILSCSMIDSNFWLSNPLLISISLNIPFNVR